MRNRPAALAALAALFVPCVALAHEDPTLHVGYAYKSCYIDLHPELTGGQLAQFSREFADAGAFVAMAGARSLAPWEIGLGVTFNQTFIDDSTPQWNNTFSHPGDDHWLGRPALGILHARLGLPRALEAEGMFTGDPQSNWAILGLALRAPVLTESPAMPVSVAMRLGYSHLLGAAELDHDAGTLEGIVSRSFGRWTPYLGVAGVVARGTEQTDELALGSKTVLGARATVGLEVALGRFRIAGQGMWASVPSAGLMLGGVI